METHSETTFRKDIEYIKTALDKLDKRFDAMANTYVPRAEIELMHKRTEEVQAALRARLQNVENGMKEQGKRIDGEIAGLSLQIADLAKTVATVWARVQTWGAAGLIALGLIEFAISRFT